MGKVEYFIGGAMDKNDLAARVIGSSNIMEGVFNKRIKGVKGYRMSLSWARTTS